MDSTTQHAVINKHHVSSSMKKDDKSDSAQRSEQSPQIKMTTNLHVYHLAISPNDQQVNYMHGEMICKVKVP